MRVRVNFTVDFDLEEYRAKRGSHNDTKQDVREAIQDMAKEAILFGLGDDGIKVQYLGQNNRYDPETRQTIHEEYVNA